MWSSNSASANAGRSAQALVGAFDAPHDAASNDELKIRLPQPDGRHLEQNESFFYLEENGRSLRVRLHDYAEIYKRPGLYEKLFHERLKCESPRMMVDLLEGAIAESQDNAHGLRVLDFGAGNGVIGRLLRDLGVARLVGLDVIPEARDAAERDRPGLYDAYFVDDLSVMSAASIPAMRGWRPNALVCIAALGFGDIPVAAFVNAFNLIESGGWVAFNIKDRFLATSDPTGFADTIRHMLFDGALELHRFMRYRHRLSVDGEALHYIGVVGRKLRDVDPLPHER